MNTNDPTPLNPALIAAGSFVIIRRELARRGYAFPPELAAIVERVIHSTADFEYASLIRTAPGAIGAGVAALSTGCPIITDVNMVRVGISRARVRALGGRVYCFVEHPDVRVEALRLGMTRSAMGMRHAAQQGLLAGSVVVVGNAPTALYELLRLIEKGMRPALIVGVPVGFVGAAESKAALMTVTDVPWITAEGCKGGSAVAVAIINALLRLATGDSPERVD